MEAKILNKKDQNYYFRPAISQKEEQLLTLKEMKQNDFISLNPNFIRENWPTHVCPSRNWQFFYINTLKLL